MLRLTLLMLLLINTSVFAQSSFWLKEWTIDSANVPDEVYKNLVDRTINLQVDQIVDPIHEGCKNPDYSDIKLRPVADLDKHFGAFWRWPSFPKSTEIFGWIRCDGSNEGAYIFVDTRRAYTLGEDSAVIRLK
jgi:hypothetical protein